MGEGEIDNESDAHNQQFVGNAIKWDKRRPRILLCYCFVQCAFWNIVCFGKGAAFSGTIVLIILWFQIFFYNLYNRLSFWLLRFLNWSNDTHVWKWCSKVTPQFLDKSILHTHIYKKNHTHFYELMADNKSVESILSLPAIRFVLWMSLRSSNGILVRFCSAKMTHFDQLITGCAAEKKNDINYMRTMKRTVDAF